MSEQAILSGSLRQLRKRLNKVEDSRSKLSSKSLKLQGRLSILEKERTSLKQQTRSYRTYASKLLESVQQAKALSDDIHTRHVKVLASRGLAVELKCIFLKHTALGWKSLQANLHEKRRVALRVAEIFRGYLGHKQGAAFNQWFKLWHADQRVAQLANQFLTGVLFKKTFRQWRNRYLNAIDNKVKSWNGLVIVHRLCNRKFGQRKKRRFTKWKKVTQYNRQNHIRKLVRKHKRRNMCIAFRHWTSFTYQTAKSKGETSLAKAFGFILFSSLKQSLKNSFRKWRVQVRSAKQLEYLSQVVDNVRKRVFNQKVVTMLIKWRGQRLKTQLGRAKRKGIEQHLQITSINEQLDYSRTEFMNFRKGEGASRLISIKLHQVHTAFSHWKVLTKVKVKALRLLNASFASTSSTLRGLAFKQWKSNTISLRLSDDIHTLRESIVGSAWRTLNQFHKKTVFRQWAKNARSWSTLEKALDLVRVTYSSALLHETYTQLRECYEEFTQIQTRKRKLEVLTRARSVQTLKAGLNTWRKYKQKSKTLKKSLLKRWKSQRNENLARAFGRWSQFTYSVQLNDEQVYKEHLEETISTLKAQVQTTRTELSTTVTTFTEKIETMQSTTLKNILKPLQLFKKRGILHGWSKVTRRLKVTRHLAHLVHNRRNTRRTMAVLEVFKREIKRKNVLRKLMCRIHVSAQGELGRNALRKLHSYANVVQKRNEVQETKQKQMLCHLWFVHLIKVKSLHFRVWTKKVFSCALKDTLLRKFLARKCTVLMTTCYRKWASKTEYMRKLDLLYEKRGLFIATTHHRSVIRTYQRYTRLQKSNQVSLEKYLMQCLKVSTYMKLIGLPRKESTKSAQLFISWRAWTLKRKKVKHIAARVKAYKTKSRQLQAFSRWKHDPVNSLCREELLGLLKSTEKQCKNSVESALANAAEAEEKKKKVVVQYKTLEAKTSSLKGEVGQLRKLAKERKAMADDFERLSKEYDETRMELRKRNQELTKIKKQRGY